MGPNRRYRTLSPRRADQGGMTLWGLLFVMLVVGISGILAIKLVPPYVDDFKVAKALENAARQPGAGEMSRVELVEAVRRRLEIDSHDSFQVDQNLSLEQEGRGRVVHIRYETVIPVAFNISALLRFEHRREIGGVD